jgi:hypothetical protein
VGTNPIDAFLGRKKSAPHATAWKFTNDTQFDDRDFGSIVGK